MSHLISHLVSTPLRKLLFTLLLLSLLSFLSLLFYFIISSSFLRSSSSPSQVVSQTPAPTPSPTPTPTPTPTSGFTILLMGRAGANHDGGALTDTILLARILDSQKTILLLSIPRDLWVSIPNNGKVTAGKINSAYAVGGGSLGKAILESITGLTVDKYITLDSSGFEQAIDAVGGIDLTVAKAFTDYEYPIAGRETTECTPPTPPTPPTPTSEVKTSPAPSSSPDPLVSQSDLISSGKLDPKLLTGLPAKYPCRYEVLHFDAGVQHMNGATALKYVRSRHSSQEGNDFSRSRRQQQVLEAVVTKLFTTSSISQIPTFFATLRGHVDTDLNAADWATLLPRSPILRSYSVLQKSLTTNNYLTQGYTADHQFALTPMAGQSIYDPIRNWLASTITPSIPLRYPVIQIESKAILSSDDPYLQKLIQAGFPTRSTVVSSKEATTSASIKIINHSLDPKTIETIQGLTGIKEITTISQKRKSIYPNLDLRILLP